MRQKLSLKPVAISRTIDVRETPIALYEVEGLPDNRKISIRNAQPASQQQPVWQIGAHTKGYNTRWTGTFESAAEALAQLQEQIDSADEETADVA